MFTQQSVVIIVTDEYRDVVNQALAAFFGDDPGSQNLTIRLSSDGQEPVTYWGLHIWQSPDGATALKDWPSGTLPTPVADWSGYGLDAVSALAAGSHMVVSVMSATTDNFQTMPQTNFTSCCGALGLQRIV